ncbi:MAG: phosphoenolpyruvate--protein phosphotransferase [Planctomycetota bacterium]
MQTQSTGASLQQFYGIGVSPGIVVGRVFVLDDGRRRIPRRTVPSKQINDQIRRLNEAIAASVEDLERVRDSVEDEMGADAAKIFGFHIGMLRDKNLLQPMEAMIRAERVTAEHAADVTLHGWAERFRQMPDSAFTTKVNDITDLAQRLIDQLVGEHTSELDHLEEDAIVVSRELTPSQTVSLDRERVIAIATDMGGRTSHTSIVARALGIPAVVGLERLGEQLTDGTEVIVDGGRGVVIVEPDAETIKEYQASRERRQLFQLSLREAADLEPITRDGVEVQILGNIEFADEIERVLEVGADGVGLFRTEFLYLAAESEPDEAAHYAAYKSCVDRLQGRPLTIRTMDLGADKYTQAQSEDPERNPALGLRSIRYCLKHLPMFKRQLRALLRASAFGPVKVMFPLVTNIAELREARHVLNDVMEDLEDEGIDFDRSIDVGMMVEVPSAALLANSLAREVDFFSVGTNDLVQYTLAVDRTNERVAGMFNPGHPAVLKLVRDVIRAGRRRDVPVTCCGEAAGEIRFAVLLLGLGVRTLSVSPGSVPVIKRLIRSIGMDQCERMAKRAIAFDSDSEVTMYVRDRLRKILPEAFDDHGLREG